MEPSDRELSELYRQQTGRSRRPGTSASCPEPAELLRLAEQDVDPAERDELVAHVAECADCAAELRALLERPLPGASELDGDGAPLAKVVPMRRRATLWIGALAAALLVALALGLVRGRFTPTAGEVVRGPTATAVDPAADAVLDAAPARLSWPALAASDRPVRVRLLDEQGTVIVERTTGGDSLSLTPTERTALRSGRFVWVVETPQQGERLGPFWFEIVPPSPTTR